MSMGAQIATGQSGFQVPMRIKDVIESINRRKYLLPAIQREFVWDETQIIRLFDSLMRDYPIGSFLFWNLEKQKIRDFQFYEFVKDYHERDNTHNPKADVTGENTITTILDGQQRLTALYVGLKGTYSSKIPGKRWESKDAFPVRKLYVNLLSLADKTELLYQFSFKTDLEAKFRNENQFWFRVGNVLEFVESYDVIDFLRDNDLLQPKISDPRLPERILSLLFKVINEKGVINYYLEASQELDKVLNIFIRVNSGGTELSYSDLLLSIATARWKTKDAREEITRFVDDLNQMGDGFRFDKDLVMKSCLVLSDISDIAFKGDNFNLSNMEKIEEKWEEIKKAIRIAVDLIANFGYNFQTLTAGYAVIPIAYYILKNGKEPNIIDSNHYRLDRERIKKWMTLSLLKRAFSGAPDNVLRPLRDIIKSTNDGFPLEQIVEKFKGTNKSINVDPEDIDSFLFYSYGKPHTFSVLALLYPTLDFTNKFHVDHIFANSFFRKSELRRRGIPDSKLKFYLDNNDYIGNLQLLPGLANEEKLNAEFDEWLNKICLTPAERSEYKFKHYIPAEIDLSFNNFEEFFMKRNELIARELKKILLL
jgi:uncharacterized protein with ParB-like and HNH nuclease domain